MTPSQLSARPTDAGPSDLELRRQLRSAGSRSAFLAGAHAVLRELFAADTITWEAVDVAAPRRRSDLVGRGERTWARAYTEHLHPFRAEYQLTIRTGPRGTTAGRCWTLHRAGRDFSDAERELAARLQPVLVALDIAWGAAPADPVAAPDDLDDADGGRSRAGARAEVVALTGREREVLTLLARGLTAAAIGRVCRISERTVRKHLENCYRKLGTHDRLRAVSLAHELGLIRRPGPPPSTAPRPGVAP